MNSSLPVAKGFPSFRIKSTGSFSITLARQKGCPRELLAEDTGLDVCPWLAMVNVAIIIAVAMFLIVLSLLMLLGYCRGGADPPGSDIRPAILRELLHSPHIPLHAPVIEICNP